MKKNLIVGLGNPGAEYAMTYHNAGTLAVQSILNGLAKEAGEELSTKTHAGLFRYVTVGNRAFVIPLTFMNESGAAVREAMKKFGTLPKDLTVIHDESDLPIGQYKIVTGGSSAGHKGIQSIIDAIGTSEFRRLRIGIRDPQEKKRSKAESFVLQGITPANEKDLAEVFRQCGEELGITAP
jgi:PTH1 family peptidyl-tRNA hydrolase